MLKATNRKYVLALLLVLAILVWFRRSRVASVSQRSSAGAPVVLVLAANTKTRGNNRAATYLQKVIDNRTEYAKKHGYHFVVKDLQSYSSQKNTKDISDGWRRLFALREVLEEYPDSEWLWYLDQDAIIMDTHLCLTDHILNPERLDHLMLKDEPIVPPDSVIRTLKTATADSIQFILSQDHSGLNTKSFLLKNGDFAKYLLDTWAEPMYRSYGFDRQEVSALEHLVQWHYTILSKSALLPKRLLASYNTAAEDIDYKEGDFVVVLDGCRDTGRSCDVEFERYWQKLHGSR